MAKKRKGPTPRRGATRPASRPPARAATARPERRKPPAYQEQMFFPRLRNHAKWAFVGLALVFIVGFVVFGVGSGNGVGDLFGNGGLIAGSSSAPSIKALEKRTQSHPQDASAWHKLALAYQGDQQNDRAIAALKRYLALKPKDTASIANLAALYQSQATTAQQKLADLYQHAPSGLSASPFGAPALAAVLGSDPLESAVQSDLQQKAMPLSSKYQQAMAASLTTYRSLVKTAPRDAQARLQLGSAAEGQGDYKTALASYRAFLRLAPNDPNAPKVTQEIAKVKKLLKSSSSSTSTQVKPSG
jgi:Flp pilus assembly protein TadD